jgi:hypothetical protein
LGAAAVPDFPANSLGLLLFAATSELPLISLSVPA